MRDGENIFESIAGSSAANSLGEQGGISAAGKGTMKWT
jgi:hypothetical protein